MDDDAKYAQQACTVDRLQTQLDGLQEQRLEFQCLLTEVGREHERELAEVCRTGFDVVQTYLKPLTQVGRSEPVARASLFSLSLSASDDKSVDTNLILYQT